MNKTICLSALTALFALSLFSYANAGYYDFYYESCCSGAYVSTGYYNPQGDPSYLRYDPYSYEVTQYTGSIPSYPYEYGPTTYYPSYYAYRPSVYAYGGYGSYYPQSVYSTVSVYPLPRVHIYPDVENVYAGYTGLYRSYAYQVS